MQGSVVNRNKVAPFTQIGLTLLLALRIMAPYTLPIGGFMAFCIAGFLHSTLVGFVVLGSCLILMQVILELGSRE